MTRPLYVAGVTNFHLYATKCVCGERNVHGFWSQLTKVTDRANRRVWVYFECRACGRVDPKMYRLTTAARTRHRLVSWRWAAAWLLPYVWYLPWRWRAWLVPRIIGGVSWLERRVPI